MRYYNVSFSYSGLKMKVPTDDARGQEAEQALRHAYLTAEKMLNLAGLKNKLAYCWTDGSLYRFIESKLNLVEIQKLLRNTFKEQGLSVSIDEIHEIDQFYNPRKNGCKTIKEYMDKK